MHLLYLTTELKMSYKNISIVYSSASYFVTLFTVKLIGFLLDGIF